MLNSDILNDQNFKTNISKLLDHFKWIDFMYLNQSILQNTSQFLKQVDLFKSNLSVYISHYLSFAQDKCQDVYRRAS